ncbi:MAG: hypothetical protein A2580_09230 [Hydrogenophilales bacterium RIFOXYD1_FULL_62_11]|nr:MAG: hypothetical protein A2580_09230 [Hydrogenophilales bacterium RIFOXYD1_FULL_62_11]
MDKFLIVVPEGHTGIDAGSAVVTPAPLKGERVLCHYESNRFGAVNMKRFVEKCFHAAGRAAVAYPTIAKSMLPADSLKVVGSFDLTQRCITEVTDPDALRAWAGDIGDLAV